MISAATGGLFGLGFGFSLISAAEVFYFGFIRWVIYLFRGRKEKKSTKIKVLPAKSLTEHQHLSFYLDGDKERLDNWAKIYNEVNH